MAVLERKPYVPSAVDPFDFDGVYRCHDRHLRVVEELIQMESECGLRHKCVIPKRLRLLWFGLRVTQPEPLKLTLGRDGHR